MRKGLIVAAALPVLLLVPLMMGGEDGKDDSLSTEGTTGDVVNVPEEYRAAVIKAGAVCEEISPALIAAQIEAESNWDADAVSPAGAQGIAQFMPATWETAGKDGDGDGKADITNPADAIWSQAHYMCDLAAQIKERIAAGSLSGDVAQLALAAYNAGLGAVLDAGGIPPYLETQQYVPKIMELTSKYTAEPGTSSGGGSAGGQQAIATARSYLGTPYVWGGDDDGGLDCSGLTMLAWQAAGVSLPHDSRAQYLQGMQVPVDQAQPGDLLFWSSDGSQESIYHVALYLGDDNMIEAPTFGMVVREAAVDHQGLMPNAVRL